MLDAQSLSATEQKSTSACHVNTRGLLSDMIMTRHVCVFYRPIKQYNKSDFRMI